MPTIKQFEERKKGNYEQLKKEENEKSSSSDEEENPDCCEWCDTRFNLTYVMNKGDPALIKKYDAYFGSPDDDGDLCPECMDKR